MPLLIMPVQPISKGIFVGKRKVEPLSHSLTKNGDDNYNKEYRKKI